MPQRPDVMVGLLGPVTINGRPVSGLRARRLLVSLVLADGRPRSAQRLIDDVWEDDPPRSPGPALQTQISRLRPLLSEATIDGVGTAYRLTGVHTDIAVAQRLGSEGTPTSIADAIALWRGEPGDDLGAGSPLATDVARRANAVRRQLDDAHAAHALATGDFATARDLAQVRCATDPLDESAHVLLMRALTGEGRRADALAVFARLRRRLASDLGVAPGGEATAVNAELLLEDAPTPNDTARRSSPKTVGLRADPTPLIGREDDLAAIASGVEAHRLVTILGPGGVGKTRVANAVGNVLAQRGLPVFFVPLASVRDNDDVVAALAQALEVGEADLNAAGRPRLTVGDLADRLADAVRGRESVLILDNCEQVIDACARIVDNLIAAEPRLRVITTSRAPLQIAAEQVYPLPVLDSDGEAPPAVELFTVRARAVRPDADLPLEKVARLCHDLDGLPLAIELAAARMRTMSIDEISARLAQRFEFLRSASRTAPDRHRTLRAVIDWSWDLLDDEARQALRRLCRFPAGFSSTAAATVLGRSGTACDDVLDALANQSLLTVAEVAGVTRYRMLEMVREFGEERLVGSGEEAGVDAAMAAWARGFAIQLRRDYETNADRTIVASISVEVENLVWVLRRAIGRGDAPTIITVFPAVAAFWSMRGLHAEVLAWSPRILAALPRVSDGIDGTSLDDDTRELWQATLLICAVHQYINPDLRELARARADLRALRRPNLADDLPMEFGSSLLLAPAARVGVRRALAGTRSSNPEIARASLTMRANLRENAGNFHGALADATAVRDRTSPGDLWASSAINITTGSIHGQLGEWELAVEHYRSGIETLQAIGADEDELQARSYLLITLVALGRLDEADEQFAIIAGGWTPADPDPQGNPEVVAATLLSAAAIARARGRDTADLYARAGDLLIREHPGVTRDPGAAMILSVATLGLVLHRDFDRAARILHNLASGMVEMFGTRGWHDAAQAGTMALAAGIALATHPDADATARRTGGRLMSLARRIGTRRDFPLVDEVLHSIDDVGAAAVPNWTEEADGVASMSRRDAIAEFTRLLRDEPDYFALRI
ncbi:MAG TPA: BTAD domain-containing putative transcriptional regulator [Gordonia sp. (in: high G+C Gram-positive bacteria)]|uniref:BTAD domain-containing putative transcriptional regulator n=1 Tax=unclassified Gordonia (in: high G+C Gram-positive bacteria) TaxID=2657482 RepID=UPI0025BFBBC8|nr:MULTISPECIES: BTAD domain-containing putative transcriptional regulator [unclassified Gordonia (in: high G+C Gram-positive bacteria)]HNP55702.1 BTAD domain-containing putative transcriptional regulator [Gordonia sp. (in: high G+C Gram-positive bacteria)]HRC49438.1 BTAD domain-containing putative transcriptional regulator [Gordonia sp. (in: high G+C Gram-positive bacteria)]